MKSYPSIDGQIRRGVPFFVFAKYDGSNMRAEWHPKKGFWKFGSRTQLIDETNPLGKSIPLIKQKYESALTDIFKKERFEEAT